MNKKISLRVLAGAVLLAAILYVCYFSGLDALGLVGPDEPRYAAIAREMAATGDWVTPRLFGQPWFEKPALYYWSAGLAFRSGLTDETAARLPSGIFALLATLGIAWAARRFYGARTALTLLLMLPTCAGMIGFSHAAATDMPFAACLTLAMVAATQLLWPEKRARQASPLQDGTNGGLQPEDHPAPAWAWACAWGFFLGLAALAKGPAALALAAGSATLWVIATRRWRDALRLFHPAGILMFCVTALPWYALCAQRNPDFLRVFLIEHNFERFTSNRFQHAQPFWFFAPILLLAVFPWTLLLGACGQDAVRLCRKKRLADSPAVFFGCWSIFPFVFFSVSQSKLPGYILPAVPPLMLLIARSLERRLEINDAGVRGWMFAVGITFLLLAAGAFLEPRIMQSMRIPTEPKAMHWESFRVREGSNENEWKATPYVRVTARDSLVPLLAGGVVILLGLLRRTRAAVRTAAASVTLIVMLVCNELLPGMDRFISARAVTIFSLQHARARGSLAVYHLARPWSFGLNFYAGGVVPEWTPQSGPARVITNDAGFDELQRLGVRMDEGRWFSRQATSLHVE